MKRFWPSSTFLKLLLSLCFFPALTLSQDSLKSFVGGDQDLSLLFSSSILTGMGCYESAAGTGITTLRPTPATIYWNPAGLAFLNRGGVSIEMLPQLTYSPDLSETINEQIDSQLESSENLVYDSDDIEYPAFNLNAGQSSRTISSLAIAFPYYGFTFAASYLQSLNLQIDMVSSGLETRIMTNEVNPSDNATIFTRTNVNLFLDLNSDAVSFAASRKLGEKFALGLSLSRLNTAGSVNGILAPDGVFNRRGVDKSFNDPSAGWANDFYSSIVGDFQGGSWGFKSGVAFHPFNSLGLNLLYSYNQKMILPADMSVIQYFYPALNLNAEGDEDIFDLNNINPAQPTQTSLADNQAADEICFQIPSYVAFGAAFRSISLTVNKYFAQLSYSYDLARDGNWVTYSRGLKPQYGALLGFDFKTVRLSLGAVMADEVVDGYQDNDGNPVEPSLGIIIPRFNLGTGFKIGNNWRADLLLIGLPEAALRMSATYSFPE